MNIFEIFNFAKKEQYQLFESPLITETLEKLEDKSLHCFQHLSMINDSVTNEMRIYLAPKLKEIWLNIPTLCEAFLLLKGSRGRIKDLIEGFLKVLITFSNKLKPTHLATNKEVDRWIHDTKTDLANLK
jgi:hypothetical protein